MVRPREDSAQSPLSEGRLERSGGKAAAIRRGDLKISGPLPVDDAEGQELSKRHTDPITFPSRDFSPNRQHFHTASLDGRDAVVSADTQPIDVQSHHLHHNRSSDAIREQQRAMTPEPEPYRDIPSALMSPAQSPTARASKKRKEGRFRNVLRRMFTKKSKQRPPSSRHEYSHSAPPILPTPSVKKPEEAPQQILPQAPTIKYTPQNITPATPLRSHLPFPMNVNAPDHSGSPRQLTSFDPPSPVQRRRRASLPSLVFSTSEAAALSAIWAGSGAKVITEDEQSLAGHEPEIGVAVTSAKQVKRRSRSTSALNDLIRDQPQLLRRRSAEIKYWRESYTGISHNMSATDADEKAKVDQVVAEEDRDEPPISEPSEAKQPSIEEQRISEFNFGPLASLESERDDSFQTEDELQESDKENEAPFLSLEERLAMAEETIRSLQQSIRKLEGRTNRRTIILENAPRRHRSQSRSGSSFNAEDARNPTPPQHASSDQSAPAWLSSPSTIDTLQQSQTSNIDASVRPSASSPTFAHSTSSTTISELVAHLTTLTDLLHHERNARKNLEAQLYVLRDDFHALQQSVMSTHGTTKTGYPTPSLGQIIGPTEAEQPTFYQDDYRVDSDTVPRAQHNSLRGHLDTERYPSYVSSGSVDKKHISRFSWEDSEGKQSVDYSAADESGTQRRRDQHDDDDVSHDTDKEDIASPNEVFETPTERSYPEFVNEGGMF